MIYGFTFNDIHLNSFENCYMKSVNRTLSPALRKRQLVIPGRHGTWDFESSYENRFITIEINILENTLYELRNKARKLAAWLRGKGKLIFDDEPDKYYTARIYKSIDIEQLAATGKCPIEFECQPLAYYVVTTGEDILLDSDLILDSDITLDNKINYTYSITGNTTIQVDNFGYFEARPKIEISGTFSTFIITINGKSLTINEAMSNGTIIIDNENYTVKKNGTNTLGAVTGDLNTFLELNPGINNVNISGTGLNCSVLFDFRPLYL